jgi:hypothetical protein
MKIFKLVFLAIALIAVSGNAAAGQKVDVCHKGETINVSKNALKAHLRHGDVKSKCVDKEKYHKNHVVVIFRCDRDGVVTPVSSTVDMPVEADVLMVIDGEEPLGCADAIKEFMRIGFHLLHVNTGPVGATTNSDERKVDDNGVPVVDEFGEPVFVEEREYDFATEYLFKGVVEVEPRGDD